MGVYKRGQVLVLGVRTHENNPVLSCKTYHVMWIYLCLSGRSVGSAYFHLSRRYMSSPFLIFFKGLYFI